MIRIENDETKGTARPFLILAHVRTGGTFCAHALSNHPQVFCDRGEVMHHRSMWRKYAGMKPGALCRFLWNQTGYQASGFRLIYRQAFHKRVWPAIEQDKPHILHLQRHSLIRQALSSAYNQMVRAGKADYHPVHSFEERKPPQQELPVKQALYRVRKLARERKQGQQRLKGYPGPVLDVWYEAMVGDTPGSATQMAPQVAKQICRFLGVETLPLRVDLRRDFPVPTPQMFNNWGELEKTLRKEGFGDAVDYELEYWDTIVSQG